MGEHRAKDPNLNPSGTALDFRDVRLDEGGSP